MTAKIVVKLESTSDPRNSELPNTFWLRSCLKEFITLVKLGLIIEILFAVNLLDKPKDYNLEMQVPKIWTDFRIKHILLIVW